MKYIVMLVLVVTCNVFAQSNLYAKKSAYSLAFVNMGMDYKEYGSAGELLDSEESNNLLGFEIGYDFVLQNDTQGSSSVAFLFGMYGGTTKYVGSNLNNPAGRYGDIVSTTDNTIYDASAEYKAVYPLSSIDLVYGVGAGYRAWYRKLSSIQEELYSWFYVTPVVGISKNFTSWNIALLGRYKYAIQPTMTANDVSSDFKLGKEDTIEVDIPVNYHYNENIDFFAEFIYARQTIGESDVVYQGINGYVEPDSTDDQGYLKIGLSFKY